MTGPFRCYVSAPLGRKSLPDGRTIDHDQVYGEGVRPVLERLGGQAVRLDEIVGGAITMKSVLASLVSCEVMVADITGSNPNVMYELGIRHALRRNVTVMIMAAGGHIPYDLAYSRVLVYQIDEAGQVSEDGMTQFRANLSQAVREGLARITNDSPLYEFYPQLSVALPEELMGADARRRSQPRPPGLPGTLMPGTPPPGLPHMEKLRSLRDASAWEELVQFVADLPPEISSAPEAIQTAALALNRLGRHDDAIARIRRLIDETGGDAESYGILGSIYKARHRRTSDANDLDAAISSYEAGFAKTPSDYFAGINAASLRARRNTANDRDQLSTLLPRVKEAVDSRLTDGVADYWTLTTAVELACIAHDWTEAETLARRTSAQRPSAWMVESTATHLRDLGESMDPPDRTRLEQVVTMLREANHA